MAAPVKPNKKTANGKDTWWIVPAIASQSAPTVAEVNATAGLNVTCFLLAEQEGITATSEKVRLARLLCETTTSEGLGETTFAMSDIQFVFDPQAAANHNDKKVWALLKDGYTGFLVRRQGVKSATEASVAEDDFVDVVPVEIAPAIPGKSSTDASGIYTATAPVAVTGTPTFNVAVVDPS